MANLTIDMLTREMARLVRVKLPWAVTIHSDYCSPVKTNQPHKAVHIKLLSGLDFSLDEFSNKYLVDDADKLAQVLNYARVDYYYKLPIAKVHHCCVVEYDGLSLRGILSNELVWDNMCAVEACVLSFDCLTYLPKPPTAEEFLRKNVIPRW